jgi:putative ABC transport system permease protein
VGARIGGRELGARLERELRVSQLSKLYWAARERVRTVFLRRRAEEDMEKELRFHLEMEADKLARSEGLSREEAYRRAGVAFGGVERFKEEVRDARGLDWLAGTTLDFVLGLRMLVKYPALTIVGGLGIAVGIAVSVGFFTFMRANINPTLPLDQGDRIVALENRDVVLNNEDRRVVHDFLVWRAELQSVKDLGAFRTVDRNMRTGDEPSEPMKVAEMTAAGFRVARIAPELGRYLVDDDERLGAPLVLVIGYDVWQNRFGGDRGVLGREVRLDGRVHTIVGVMPKDFAFPMSHELWTPFRPNPNAYGQRQGPWIYVFGRLATDVTMERAQAELEEFGRRSASAFPKTHATLRPMVMPYVHSLTDIQGITSLEVVTVQFTMTTLLFVVALNVAVLVYARTAMRQGEIAVRMALGASRRRVVMQLFIEALVLSIVSAAVGFAIAHVGIRLGNRMYEHEFGKLFWSDFSVQPSSVLFTIGIAVITAAIVGILPALQATGKRLQHDIRQMGGSTGMRLGKTWTALIVVQVAIAVAALPAAANEGWKSSRDALTRPTYPPEEFLVAGLGMEFTDSIADPGVRAARFAEWVPELLRLLEGQPEVMGVTSRASLSGRSARVDVEGVPAPEGSLIGHRVTSGGTGPGFFAVFGTRILAGRGFQPADADTASTAVIVNETFVRQVLGGGSALGRRLRYVPVQEQGDADAAKPGRWFEVVGVSSDLERNPADPTLVRPAVWYAVAPSQAHLAQSVDVAVRLRRPTAPADFVPKLRRIAMAVDPALRLGRTYSMAEFEKESQLVLRLVGLGVGLVIVSVFLLSAAGVYALTSFTVTRRRREIGVRTALGAHPRHVLLGIFAGIARQVGLGLALGIATAVAIEIGSGGELMGGRGSLLLPIFGVLMAVAALVGALGPARRGLKIQPIEALRSEA